jgi:hypothetical protein
MQSINGGEEIYAKQLPPPLIILMSAYWFPLNIKSGIDQVAEIHNG